MPVYWNSLVCWCKISLRTGIIVVLALSRKSYLNLAQRVGILFDQLPIIAGEGRMLCNFNPIFLPVQLNLLPYNPKRFPKNLTLYRMMIMWYFPRRLTVPDCDYIRATFIKHKITSEPREITLCDLLHSRGLLQHNSIAWVRSIMRGEVK